MRLSTRGRIITTGIVLAVLIAYVAAYRSIAKPFCGKLGDDFMELRVFNGRLSYYLFAPAVAMEAALKGHELYGHVQSGASLPPAADCRTRELIRVN